MNMNNRPILVPNFDLGIDILVPHSEDNLVENTKDFSNDLAKDILRDGSSIDFKSPSKADENLDNYQYGNSYFTDAFSMNKFHNRNTPLNEQSLSPKDMDVNDSLYHSNSNTLTYSQSNDLQYDINDINLNQIFTVDDLMAIKARSYSTTAISNNNRGEVSQVELIESTPLDGVSVETSFPEISNANDLRFKNTDYFKPFDMQSRVMSIPDSNELKKMVDEIKRNSIVTISPPSTDAGMGKKSRRRSTARQTQCSFCLKVFNQASHFEVHIRSHIGYKPHKCRFCNVCFTQSGNLKTHEKLHTSEKDFECEICNKKFSRKGNLASHIATHNRLRLHICKFDHCKKSFTQLGNMKAHHNKFHRETMARLSNILLNISAEDSLSDDDKYMLQYYLTVYKNSKRLNLLTPFLNMPLIKEAISLPTTTGL
ncbi:hypothetical protein TPHA_0F01810 [Tetrapisispora phaffii CBS 4417]|uniref:C2H2-type domain-containing protein n=1 Tax=Tetrapisispora phaffii (strain ATCC 24235 / CBS 4417 / NBRC 1672 / NRRL Y-8282 / UCD 70-5) TaxID=1071381 RepID=G8BV82_TETPH|nr:hypothetical protein TPHA_0F01810 [Tetrapisispora phaffii CBS 4417]CCE63664.1 hypothetical protein TPHA_0F01810 [Tetrapisispora phaffii CBS 4417]